MYPLQQSLPPRLLYALLSYSAPLQDRPSGLAFPEDVRVEPPRRTEALEGDAPWDHDAYDEGPRPKRRLALGLGSQRPATNLDDRLDRSSVVSEPGRL